MAQLPIEQGITRFNSNEERVDDFVNSFGSYMSSNGQSVETLPSLMQRLQQRYLTIISRGDWVSATSYAINDVVKQGATSYLCVVPHTSNSFNADLNAKLWVVYQGVGPVELDAFGKRNYFNYVGEDLRNTFNGSAIGIDGFGDSTMWSADTANLSAQAPETTLQHLQTILRRYYSNNLITVNNKAISGTTVAQMLAGTDGSGKTFDVRVSESTAKFIFCNHCINSVQLEETAIQYKKDLHEVVAICRKYNKTPILVTPNPILPFSIGDRRKCEQLKYYVTAMREVSAEASCMLVDNNEWFNKLIRTGKYKVSEVIPDGVHPANKFYLFMARNMAIPLITDGTPMMQNDGFLPAYSSQVLATNNASVIDYGSKFGGSVVTGNSGNQSIRAAILIGEGGLDIYSSHILWDSGTSNGSVTVDRVLYASPFKLYGNLTGDQLITDHEICIMRNAEPGLHFIEFESTAGALSLNYLRARPTIFETVSQINAINNYRQRLITNYEHFATADNSFALLDKFPTTHIDRPYSIEFTATLAKESGVIVSGLKQTSLSAGTGITGGFVVGLDADGFASIWEYRTAGLTKLFTSNVDLSASEKTYVVEFTPGYDSNINLFVNSASIGVGVKTQNYLGGVLGLWKGKSGGSVIIKSLDYLNRS